MYKKIIERLQKYKHENPGKADAYIDQFLDGFDENMSLKELNRKISFLEQTTFERHYVWSATDYPSLRDLLSDRRDIHHFLTTDDKKNREAIPLVRFGALTHEFPSILMDTHQLLMSECPLYHQFSRDEINFSKTLNWGKGFSENSEENALLDFGRGISIEGVFIDQNNKLEAIEHFAKDKAKVTAILSLNQVAYAELNNGVCKAYEYLGEPFDITHGVGTITWQKDAEGDIYATVKSKASALLQDFDILVLDAKTMKLRPPSYQEIEKNYQTDSLLPIFSTTAKVELLESNTGLRPMVTELETRPFSKELTEKPNALSQIRYTAHQINQSKFIKRFKIYTENNINNPIESVDSSIKIYHCALRKEEKARVENFKKIIKDDRYAKAIANCGGRVLSMGIIVDELMATLNMNERQTLKPVCIKSQSYWSYNPKENAKATASIYAFKANDKYYVLDPKTRQLKEASKQEADFIEEEDFKALLPICSGEADLSFDNKEGIKINNLEFHYYAEGLECTLEQRLDESSEDDFGATITLS